MNILLFAFTHDNLGDDLFIKIICEKYSNVKFHIPLRENEANESLKKIKNLIFSKRLFNIYQSLKKESIINNHLKIKTDLTALFAKKYLSKFDASVYIVGSAFIQKSADKDYSNLLLLNKMVNISKKFFLINSNFGPYVDDKYLQDARKIISKMDDVCFRDEYSYDLFKDLKNVRYASDVVLSLKPATIVENNYVLISVMDLGSDYFEFISKLIKKIYEKNLKVKLVAFCKSQNDLSAVEEINKIIKTDVLVYDGNMEEILKEFNACKAIIATRFHSMILGFAYNKSIIPVIYSQKTLKVIEDSDFKGLYIELSKLKEYSEESIINELLNDHKPISLLYKDKSLLQFSGLNKYIGEYNEN